jgi:hypothetical protein
MVEGLEEGTCMALALRVYRTRGGFEDILDR